jgi:hypothetical protein
MGRISGRIILVTGFLTAVCFLCCVHVKADEPEIINNGNQTIRDEGYGNADAEYYNNEDDSVNGEEPPDAPQNDTIGSITAIRNDAQ